MSVGEMCHWEYFVFTCGCQKWSKNPKHYCQTTFYEDPLRVIHGFGHPDSIKTENRQCSAENLRKSPTCRSNRHADTFVEPDELDPIMETDAERQDA